MAKYNPVERFQNKPWHFCWYNFTLLLYFFAKLKNFTFESNWIEFVGLKNFFQFNSWISRNICQIISICTTFKKLSTQFADLRNRKSVPIRFNSTHKLLRFFVNLIQSKVMNGIELLSLLLRENFLFENSP